MRNNTGYECAVISYSKVKGYDIELDNMSFVCVDWQPAGHEKNWKPKKGNVYWVIDEYGGISEITFVNTHRDRWNLITGNYAKTEQEMIDKRRFLEIDRQVRDIADEQGRPTDEDWNNINIQKYFLCYEPTDNSIKLGWNRFSKKAGVIYCLKCDEFLATCLDCIGQADMEFWAKYERR